MFSYCNIAGEELVSKVSGVDLMKTDACSKILTEAKDYHIVTATQPCLQTRRTQVCADIVPA